MSGERKRDVVRTGLLAAWGMATLVLVFCVALLVFEMIRNGQDPLDLSIGPGAQIPALPGSQPDTASTMQDVVLYFASEDGSQLASEPRKVVHSAEYTVANCREVLDALIAGPSSELTPLVSPNVKIRGIYLLEGSELVVDLSRDLELTHPKSATAELLMVRGIVLTLTQDGLRGSQETGVQRVRFLFEGSPQDGFPAHLDVSKSVEADRAWLEIASTDNG